MGKLNFGLHRLKLLPFSVGSFMLSSWFVALVKLDLLGSVIGETVMLGVMVSWLTIMVNMLQHLLVGLLTPFSLSKVPS